MKKIFVYLLPIAMSFVFDLGLFSALELFIIIYSPFGNTGAYPRFVPFCFLLGILCLFGFIYFIWLFYKCFKKIPSANAKKAYVFIGGTIFLTGFYLFPFVINDLFRWLHITF